MTRSKDKTLIVIEADPKKDIFFREWQENGYQAAVLFKKISKPLRALRRLWLKGDYPLSDMWLGDWSKHLDEYDSIIIHMSRLTRFLPKQLAKRYPHLDIICWYWNTIDELTMPIDFKNDKITYWSFDENDCKLYGFRHNIQYYCPLKNNQSLPLKSDIYFIGRDKGREDRINEVKVIADELGLKTQFHVIKDSKDLVPYSKVKQDLLTTRSILEINKSDQVGFTLRVMESLFYGLKLITDNKAIKQSDIYNFHNIFILDEDDPNRLREFLDEPYDHSVDKYKEQYDLDTWFNNFYER